MDRNKAFIDSQRYAEKVKKRFPECKIILYGSYVNGNPTEESDIDIAVIFNSFNGNWLETSSQLWADTEEINTKIEPILLDQGEDKSGFCEHVLNVGIEV